MYRERAQGFNTQPPEGGCITSSNFATIATSVSTHSRPKAAAVVMLLNVDGSTVSTHSRPKAAASKIAFISRSRICFNTQPPEGGCPRLKRGIFKGIKFQHTAARRRLHDFFYCISCSKPVSTHSRPKAAAVINYDDVWLGGKFQHTAARRRLPNMMQLFLLGQPVSTHSRPKAAASAFSLSNKAIRVSTHSRPKAAAHYSFFV